MEFTIKIDEEFYINEFSENEFLVSEINNYLNNNVDNDLQYVLFRELGGIDFLDSNNQNIDPTDETIDWDYMINQAINLIIELYNNNK